MLAPELDSLPPYVKNDVENLFEKINGLIRSVKMTLEHVIRTSNSNEEKGENGIRGFKYVKPHLPSFPIDPFFIRFHMTMDFFPMPQDRRGKFEVTLTTYEGVIKDAVTLAFLEKEF